ncbi:MAG: hypothetical protein IJE79_03830 [Alphaproteobacteria bacterium]|nr:hypothetical protein [Alphaproteobacteria bacterium]
MKRPTVFSLVHEQSVFMTVIVSLLTFLSVLALGISLSIGTGVIRWNSQWDRYATIQLMDSAKTKQVQETITKNSDKIKTVKQITTAQMQELMSPWISGNSVLKNYLPQMWEIEFTTKSDLETVGPEFSQHARFLPHARALKTSTSAGWKMIAMSSLILILTLGAIGFCISYIAHNTAMLHRRELEILNQVGASDNFIARQMQIIVGKICLSACSIGYLCALPIILVILSTAHSARIGLMAMLGLSSTGWILLTILPITIIIFSIWITKRTTINILKNS